MAYRQRNKLEGKLRDGEGEREMGEEKEVGEEEEREESSEEGVEGEIGREKGRKRKRKRMSASCGPGYVHLDHGQREWPGQGQGVC